MEVALLAPNILYRDHGLPLLPLMNLRNPDKDLIRLHFWDELDDAETAFVLRFDVDELPERMARAGTRFLTKVNRKRPNVAISDVESILRELKPGEHHRFEDRT